MCNYLNDGGESFVPFIGVYSTLEHPFALVFKFADRLNLREYIRKNRDSEGLKLVIIDSHIHHFPLSYHPNS